MTKPKPKLEVKITLDFPVPVTDATGKEAFRDTVTVRRPRTVHVKRLAVLLGADLLKAVIGDQNTVNANDIEMRKLVLDVVGNVFQHDTLDELTSIIASMCGETPAFIDDVDPLDLIKFGEALLDFFPALRSIASTNSVPTPLPASDGAPAI